MRRRRQSSRYPSSTVSTESPSSPLGVQTRGGEGGGTWASGAGARVAIAGRDRARAEAVAAELGPGGVGIEMDVRDERSVHAGVDDVYELLGGVDMLVNNAGIGMRTVNPRFMSDPLAFWEVPPSGFRDVVETKLTGSFLVARAVVPRMLAAGMLEGLVVSRS